MQTRSPSKHTHIRMRHYPFNFLTFSLVFLWTVSTLLPMGMTLDLNITSLNFKPALAQS
jgi:hypothetical protein